MIQVMEPLLDIIKTGVVAEEEHDEEEKEGEISAEITKDPVVGTLSGSLTSLRSLGQKLLGLVGLLMQAKLYNHLSLSLLSIVSCSRY